MTHLIKKYNKGFYNTIKDFITQVLSITSCNNNDLYPAGDEPKTINLNPTPIHFQIIPKNIRSSVNNFWQNLVPFNCHLTATDNFDIS